MRFGDENIEIIVRERLILLYVVLTSLTVSLLEASVKK